MKIALIMLIAAAVLYYFFNNLNNQKIATQNIEQGEVFLANNAKRDGVKTTASGLQYEILHQGTKATATNTRRKAPASTCITTAP